MLLANMTASSWVSHSRMENAYVPFCLDEKLTDCPGAKIALCSTVIVVGFVGTQGRNEPSSATVESTAHRASFCVITRRPVDY
jgi:hypothetical protein